MWKFLGAFVKGILFLLGLVGLVTLPEDVQRWAELMGPVADYIALDRVEFALYAAIIVFGLWILLPVVTPFLAEARRFFKQHDRRRFNTKQPHETDQQSEAIQENCFPKADLDEWRQVDLLELWRAGCLWKGFQPHYPVGFNDPAYASFILLVNAAKAGQLTVTNPGTEVVARSLVNRSELARFAHSKGEMPEFLKGESLNEVPIEENEWIPLNEAARELFELTENEMTGQFAAVGNSPDEILNFYGVLAVQTKNIPLYGKRPPSTKRQLISPDEVRVLHIEGGATVLEDQYDSHHKYTDLEIKRADFDALAREMNDGTR